MIRKKGALSLVLVLGIVICVTPLISQSAQKPRLRQKIQEPTLPTLMPDLQVDTLEFTGQIVKVYIKNTGKVSAKGTNIKAKLIMMIPQGWSNENSIITHIGDDGIVPTKTLNDRALVTFNATGKVSTALAKTKFRIVVDNSYMVKESNEQNNTHIYNGVVVKRALVPSKKIKRK